MGLQVFDRCYAFIDGAVLGMSSGGTLEYQGDNIPVTTLVDDLAGFTPVPKSAIVSIESFVPAAGFEKDIVNLYLTNKFITLKIQFGGSGLVLERDGQVMAPSIKWGAAESTTLSFKVHIAAGKFA